MAVKKPFRISTAESGWDLATASYASKSKDVSSEVGTPHAVQFNYNGKKMYVLDNVGLGLGEVHQYTLGTRWDVSTATYDSVSFVVSPSMTDTMSLAFNPDGTQMFIGGTKSASPNRTIQAYDLSTAWDISTAVFGEGFDTVTQTISVQGLSFSIDGLKMFASDGANKSVHQYTLGVAWDVSTASYSKTKSFVSQLNTTSDIYIRADGRRLYIVSGTTIAGESDVYQYTMTALWDIAATTYDSKTIDVGTQESEPFGLTFSLDGKNMYIVGNNSDTVYQYTVGP